jgi:hypothetical protein
MTDSRILLMAKWKIISGSREFYSLRGRGNVAIGWARDLERRGVQVTVNVVVPLGVPEMPNLPPESRSAIRSHGKTAIIAVMNDDELPQFIDVTPEGLQMEYPPEPEPEEEEGTAETEASAEEDEAAEDDDAAEAETSDATA